MKIKLTSVYVNDQDKALRFYTEVLGFAKKADFSNGPFRWLTVALAVSLRKPCLRRPEKRPRTDALGRFVPPTQNTLHCKVARD